jgi:hypothetical protein
MAAIIAKLVVSGFWNSSIERHANMVVIVIILSETLKPENFFI